jgi:N-acetylmuramoyl-L-alanine amidase
MGKTVEAKKGDCVISIASAAGFADWRSIYHAPENAELRKKRPDPHVLAEGDKVFVPEMKPMEIKLKAGHTWLIKTRSLWATVELLLNDPAGKPYSGKKWELKVKDKVYSGTTTDKGGIKQKVAPDAKQGDLTMYLDDKKKLEWTIDIGGLDPIDSDSGVQARLNNLGYHTGADQYGTLGRGTAHALRDFQNDHGLPVTGKLDDNTRKRIKEEHQS